MQQQSFGAKQQRDGKKVIPALITNNVNQFTNILQLNKYINVTVPRYNDDATHHYYPFFCAAQT